MREEKMAPVHPGEILLEDFMKPLGLTQYRLAKEMNVYPRKVNEIVQGKRAITADTALRLARFFGTSPEVWMNLQAHYDLEIARDDLDERVEREVVPFARSRYLTATPTAA
jgi:addiction module HigA family antidote